MADYDKPTVNDVYTDILPQLRDNIDQVAVMFENGAETNMPIGTVQLLNGVFGKWNGATFIPEIISETSGGTGYDDINDFINDFGIVTTSSGDARYLNESANGSDIPDPSIFRDNISVSSTSETMLRANNGSDISSDATFRSNLDVYSKSEADARYALEGNNGSDFTNKSTLRSNVGVFGGLLLYNDVSDLPPGWSVASSTSTEFVVNHTAGTAGIAVTATYYGQLGNSIGLKITGTSSTQFVVEFDSSLFVSQGCTFTVVVI